MTYFSVTFDISNACFFSDSFQKKYGKLGIVLPGILSISYLPSFSSCALSQCFRFPPATSEAKRRIS